MTDANVETPHAIAVAESLAKAEVAVDLVVVEPGETSKSIETANDLWEKVLQLGADRKSVMVAVGGGVADGQVIGFFLFY